MQWLRKNWTLTRSSINIEHSEVGGLKPVQTVVDEKLNNSPGLFEKILAGSEFNYDITFKGGYFIGDYVLVGTNVNYQREKFTGT